MAIEQLVRKYRRRFRGLVTGHGFRDVPPAIVPAAVTGQGDLYAKRSIDATQLRYPDGKGDGAERLLSVLCRGAHLDSAAFRYWTQRLQVGTAYHRKAWEFALICQALYERGALRPGARGLGFAVGCEPLPALFAAFGCQILATDLALEDHRSGKWSRANQWAGKLEPLARPEICDDKAFHERVTYQPADMNDIPSELRGFDFTWSSCSFEHCGSIDLGKRFILEQMKCLAPGGWAVHTTEFNLSSNTHTRTKGHTVVFRRRDIEDICRSLQAEGHYVEPLDLNAGTDPIDAHIDDQPFTDRHLRLRIGHYAATSIGLIMRKKS